MNPQIKVAKPSVASEEPLHAELKAFLHAESLASIFCSELCAAAHTAIGVFQTSRPDRWNPNMLIRAELADGIILRAGKLLGNLNITPTDEHCYLLHALSVGMAVIDLATARKDGKRRAARTLETALTLMTKGKGR